MGVGSVFIHEADRTRLATVDVENMDDLVAIELDKLTTIDFAVLTSEKGIPWSEGKPVRYDETNGLAISKVSPEGLRFVLEQGPDAFDESSRPDVLAPIDFLDEHGIEDIFELATF